MFDPPKKELLLNTLNYFVRGRKSLTFLNLLFVLDSFRFLGEKIPEIETILEEFNSIQSDDGTWKTGHEHYVPITAQAFMFYKHIGAVPKKSLEPFLLSIDTWEKVLTHNEKHERGNYWGGLWGYVGCFVTVGQRPPWVNKYIEAVHGRFDEWSSDNHQRSHVVISLGQLGESIPRVKKLIDITISDQAPDGRWTAKDWNPAVPQTAFGISTLKILDKEGLPEVDDAIDRGLTFMESCFKIVDWKGKKCGGYSENPDDKNPDALATSIAIGAQLPLAQLEEWIRFK